MGKDGNVEWRKNEADSRDCDGRGIPNEIATRFAVLVKT